MWYGGTYVFIGREVNSQTQVVSQITKHDPALVAMDANVSPDVLKAVIKHCNAANITSESLASYDPPRSRVLNFIFNSIFVSLRRCFIQPARIDVRQRAYFRDQGCVNYTCHLIYPGIEFSWLSDQIYLP